VSFEFPFVSIVVPYCRDLYGLLTTKVTKGITKDAKEGLINPRLSKILFIEDLTSSPEGEEAPDQHG
jgi:hypothetical protein